VYSSNIIRRPLYRFDPPDRCRSSKVNGSIGFVAIRPRERIISYEKRRQLSKTTRLCVETFFKRFVRPVSKPSSWIRFSFSVLNTAFRIPAEHGTPTRVLSRLVMRFVFIRGFVKLSKISIILAYTYVGHDRLSRRNFKANFFLPSPLLCHLGHLPFPPLPSSRLAGLPVNENVTLVVTLKTRFRRRRTARVRV